MLQLELCTYAPTSFIWLDHIEDVEDESTMLDANCYLGEYISKLIRNSGILALPDGIYPLLSTFSDGRAGFGFTNESRPSIISSFLDFASAVAMHTMVTKKLPPKLI